MNDTNIIKPGQGYLDLPVSKFVLWTLPFWKSLNCTPNTLTTLGLIFSILCIYFLYKRNVILSIIFLLLRLYFDYADGLYARKYNQTSDFGNFYDSFVDIFFSVKIFAPSVIRGHCIGRKGRSSSTFTNGRPWENPRSKRNPWST